MFRIVLAQLVHTAGRTTALLLAITIATASFTVLTGVVDTNRLEVRGTAAASFRSSYDLLVRPTGSYSTLERTQGLVRPNYQSGIFGGISPAQLATIRAVDGVEVAAPVANLGYVNLVGAVRIDLRPLLDGARQQLFRVRPTFTMDRGRTVFTGAPIYVYVSRNQARPTDGKNAGLPKEWHGSSVYAETEPGQSRPVAPCAGYAADQQRGLIREIGNATYAATPWGYRDPYANTAPPMTCFFLPNRTVSADSYGAADPSELEAVIPVSLPVLLTAIDPTAENALSGLDRTVVSGRALAARDDVAPAPLTGDDRTTGIPVLAATTISLDQQVSAGVERVDTDSRRLSATLAENDGMVAALSRLPAAAVTSVAPVAAQQTWSSVAAGRTATGGGLLVGTYWQVGPSTYGRQGSALAVRSRPNPQSAYVSPQLGDPAPVGSDDSGVRTVSGTSYRQGGFRIGRLDVVGRFDPTRIVADNQLSGLSSQTYASPLLAGADQASRTALGNRPLAPSSNLAGYAAQPPALLTTLPAARFLLNHADYAKPSEGAVLEGGESGQDDPDPISVIRVRVAGVTGPDPVSRERLDQAALAITGRTGLAVDIVAGASGVPTTVILPAGRHGRPVLELTEDWARKGVVYQVISAVDRKSLALFILILTVCTLVVGNAAGAAVRTRRVGLGVLSCLGWGAGRLFAVVLSELAVVGLVAGLLGAAVAVAVGRLGGTPVGLSRALLAVPPAVLLAVLAGLVPAARAARATPLDAVRPLLRVPSGARAGRTRTVTRLALRGLSRTPGRTALAAASLAIGITALTVLLAVQQTFRGLVVGSLLGDAVALRVRTPDLVALGAILLLGVAAVADVLYLSVREQAGEFAVLRATGWPEGTLARLVATQGVGIGVIGSVAGAAAGLLAVLALTGAVPAGIGTPVAVAVLCGLVLAALATVVPALLVRRLPTTTLLAEENA